MVLSVSNHADLYTQKLPFAGGSGKGAKEPLPQQYSEPAEINTITHFLPDKTSLNNCIWIPPCTGNTAQT